MYLEKQPIISLCIATNGVIEWLFPTLDSIFNQNVSETLYEVIVANNGDNEEFDTIMNRYLNEHKNLVYNKNNSILFNNQLEAFKLGRGIFLKFINHRAIFLEGALSYMLDLIKKNLEKKPVIYFSNRILKTDEYFECNSFDMFVKTLGIYVSHTSGVGIWKDQFDRIKDNLIVNPISPHSCLLFQIDVILNISFVIKNFLRKLLIVRRIKVSMIFLKRLLLKNLLLHSNYTLMVI